MSDVVARMQVAYMTHFPKKAMRGALASAILLLVGNSVGCKSDCEKAAEGICKGARSFGSEAYDSCYAGALYRCASAD